MNGAQPGLQPSIEMSAYLSVTSALPCLDLMGYMFRMCQELLSILANVLALSPRSLWVGES